jgi:hypothetical protein
MPSLKTSLIIASAIGALVSAALIAIESPTNYAFLSLEWPGVTAAYLFWGAIGGSALSGVAIAWAVNAVVYSLGAFLLLAL